jgi:hypothetical protein
MTHRCPACGVPIAPGSAMCSTCRSAVNWTNGQPAVAFDTHLIPHDWPSGLVVATLAALSLAAVWTLVWFIG